MSLTPEPTVEELQAEVDRLNAELADRNAAAAVAPGGTAQPGVNPPNVATTSTPPVREPSSGATVIGAASDPRGGTVIGYSDGTVTLFDVPEENGEMAQPWGNAPEGSNYSHFFVTENGEVYNFVTEDNPPRVESVSRNPRVTA